MCTVFGAIGLTAVKSEELAQFAQIGLSALQHRGHEWVGVAYVAANGILHVEKRPGEVSALFGDRAFVRDLVADEPRMLLAHTRFSTTGGSTSRNAQPHYVRDRRGTVALASNGDIFDYPAERGRLEALGCRPISTNDGELLLAHILTCCGDDRSRLLEGIADLMTTIRASYSAWLATESEAYLFRDPHANRPLFYLQLADYFLFASEDTALKAVLLQRAQLGYRDGSVVVNQVLPGEAVQVRLDGTVQFHQLAPPRARAHCAFERIYFARPDSRVFGSRLDRTCYRLTVARNGDGFRLETEAGFPEEVGGFRFRLGKQLALEHPADADFVTPIPDSGTFAAIGYARQSGLDYRAAIVRNPYVARTFISPGRENRENLAKLKYSAMETIFHSKPRVAVVDDSIVFGTTTREIVAMLRTAGAKEVHFRVSCPPIRRPCRYGIDMQSKGPLIAADHSVDEVRRAIGADSLGYLSEAGLRAVIGEDAGSYCYACWQSPASDWPI